jgi:hypothetical protein
LNTAEANWNCKVLQELLTRFPIVVHIVVSDGLLVKFEKVDSIGSADIYNLTVYNCIGVRASHLTSIHCSLRSLVSRLHLLVRLHPLPLQALVRTGGPLLLLVASLAR